MRIVCIHCIVSLQILTIYSDDVRATLRHEYLFWEYVQVDIL